MEQIRTLRQITDADSVYLVVEMNGLKLMFCAFESSENAIANRKTKVFFIGDGL